VLVLCLENIVCDGYDFDGADLQACFFEGFAFGAGEEAFAVVEMTAWELDSTCVILEKYSHDGSQVYVPAP